MFPPLDPTLPEGSQGQPLRGVIIPRTKRRNIQEALTPRLRGCLHSAIESSGSAQIDDSNSSEPEILALYTLQLRGQLNDIGSFVSSNHAGAEGTPIPSQPLSAVIDGPSDRDYQLGHLPISRSFSAFAYGLGSLLVFGVPLTSLGDIENTETSLRDKRLIVWNITGRGLVCGYEAAV